MVFWRISQYRDLSGRGALSSSARWNVAGPRVVYMAESAAGALLEVCVHTPAEDIPASYPLLKIQGPELKSEAIALTGLPSDWIERPEVTRQIGAEWLKSQRTALLQVPSALAPETWNVLLNPLHPDAELFKIERSYEYPFDPRLKG